MLWQRGARAEACDSGGGAAIPPGIGGGIPSLSSPFTKSARQARPPGRRSALRTAPEGQPPLGFAGKGMGASVQPWLELRPNPVAVGVELWGDNQNF